MDNTGLVSLVYISFATQPMSDDELKDILKTARENNQKLGVTGMLLYREGLFIQVLEGKQETVKTLFDTISKDPRHQNVTTIVTYPIEKRTFEAWHMGFNKMTETAPEGLEGYSDFLNSPTSEFLVMQPDRAKQLLYAFRGQIYF
mgnify:CR=1 FL=1